MNLENPPEIADGGYWYVVKSIGEDNGYRTIAGTVPYCGWSGWSIEVGNETVYVIRTPKPVSGLVTTDQSVIEITPWPSKPRARIRGQ